MLLQTEQGGCLVIIRTNTKEGPAGFSDRFVDAANDEQDSAAFYTFFEPSLRGRFCSSLDHENRVVAVASSGTPASDRAAAVEWLCARGFRASLDQEAGGTRITEWTRHQGR
jgi:hypothetical protein